MAGEITDEYNDNVGQNSADTNNQLFASGGKSQPVYGMGARGYGANGGATRGRKAHIQFREQNSGFAPAEDYRAAKFLPGRWADLERNGVPVVMQGGDVVGLAAVENAVSGNVGEFVHQVMPANAGIKQQLVYTGAYDNEVTVDIDELFDGGNNFVGGDTRVNTSTVSTSTNFVAGNKPLAYNPTNVHSTGWEDVYTNQKFEGQVTMKTEWLCMYPISDVFMHGATIDGTAAGGANIDDELSLGVEGARRGDFGFANANIVSTGSIVLKGIRAGDLVMPNPYLPGKLISVDDFATLAMVDTGNLSGSGLKALVEAATGSAGLTMTEAYAYAMAHVVGRCFKRQPRATSDGAELTNHDIYGSTYKYMMTLPGLGLSGGQSQGIEADQEAGRAFAHALAPEVGGSATLDVVFINYEVR